MRLNKTTSHALRVLVACAKAGGELRKVADLAEALELTEQNVFKIVHLLSRAGLVAAERGRYGGVRLARPASDIRIGEVVVAMEQMPGAAGEEGFAPSAATSPGPLFDDAFDAFLAVLNQSTVADMAKAQEKSQGKSTTRAARKPAAAASPPVEQDKSRARSRAAVRAAQNKEP